MAIKFSDHWAMQGKEVLMHAATWTAAGNLCCTQEVRNKGHVPHESISTTRPEGANECTETGSMLVGVEGWGGEQ